MDDAAARLCLVGCGAIGQVHARAVELAAERVGYGGVYDADPARAAAFVERLGLDARIYQSWEEVLGDASVEGVDLCLPHSQHLARTLEVLDAGKHVFLEKPMALGSADCDRMIAAARQHGLQLSVMHNRRFNAAARAFQVMLQTGELGDPVLITAQGIEGPDTVGVRSWLAKASEGGVGMAQTVHFAYMLRWLFGPVAEVSCLTSRKGIAWMEGQVTAAFLLRFASGALGQIVSTFAQQEGTHEHRITLYGGTGQASLVGNTLEVTSSARYGDRALHRETFEVGRGAEFAEPLATFGDAIRGRGQPAVPAEEGREAVALIEAAYRSAEEGRTIRL